LTSRKLKLSVSFEENYCLLGIVSDEPDYKLCWLINEQEKTSFQKAENLVLFNKKNDAEEEYALFSYEDENTMLTYRIITNRTDSGCYLSELKHIDYLVHIQGELVQEEINEFIQGVNNLREIRMCVPVDLSRIKNKERLQLW
jgi:hypothetical protein